MLSIWYKLVLIFSSDCHQNKHQWISIFCKSQPTPLRLTIHTCMIFVSGIFHHHTLNNCIFQLSTSTEPDWYISIDFQYSTLPSDSNFYHLKTQYCLQASKCYFFFHAWDENADSNPVLRSVSGFTLDVQSYITFSPADGVCPVVLRFQKALQGFSYMLA